jgi:hypothetical protein
MTTNSTPLNRIRSGLYQVTIDVDGKPATFTFERTERGDTAYTSDIGLWAIHQPSNPGEPHYTSLREARDSFFSTRWYRDPEYGVCAK